MSGIRRHLADLAAQIRSMRVAIEAMQRQLAEFEAILLRLMAEQPAGAPGEEPPPEQQGS